MDEELVQHTFQQVREAAQDDVLPPISVEDIRAALRQMRPRAGLGVDMLSPGDFGRLPDSALAELALLFEACEYHLVWPAQ
eukprot:4127665-Pyramimonas_sp.AAC.1